MRKIGMIVTVMEVLMMMTVSLSCAAEKGFVLLPEEDFAERFYSNPSAVHDIGDPAVYRAEGSWWMVATSAADGFRIWRSDDLVTWQDEGMAYQKESGVSWCASTFWAPEVSFIDGTYYLVYSAKWYNHGTLRIGIARSDSPGGPFVDLKNEPLFDPGYAVIDAHLMQDSDGTCWLYFSRDCSENVVDGVYTSQIYTARLAEDMMSLASEPVLLTTPDLDWEYSDGDDCRWNEGPFVVRNGGKYWLFYSANYFESLEYGVGAAVSDAPDGPFVKYEQGPLLKCVTGGDGSVLVSGPGHNFCFEVGGEWFTSYHTHYDPVRRGNDRQLCIDRMGFRADGTPYINGPTLAPQLKPLSLMGLRDLLPLSLPMYPDRQAGLLTDGDCVVNSGDRGLFTLPGGSGLEYRWDAPVTADSILLYAPAGQDACVTLTLNGGHSVRLSLTDMETLPGSSLRVFFEPLSLVSLRIDTDADCRLAELRLIGPAA